MKISVKHYLNKRLKAEVVTKGRVQVKRFPLYLQVVVGNKQAQLKSHLDYFYLFSGGNTASIPKTPKKLDKLSEDEFARFERSKALKRAVESEKEFIKFVITEIGILNMEEIALTNFSEARENYLTPITKCYDHYEDIFVHKTIEDKLSHFPGLRNALHRWSTFDIDISFHLKDALKEIQLLTQIDLHLVTKETERISKSKGLVYEFLISLELSDIPLYFFLYSGFKHEWYNYLTQKYPKNRKFCILHYVYLKNILAAYITSFQKN